MDIIGASFSHLFLSSLNHNPLDALRSFNKLGLRWIRLGSYWNEIEPKKGKFNFNMMDRLLNFCEENRLKVLLTVGMKAPRHPEYYIPDWLVRKVKIYRAGTINTSNTQLLTNTLNFINKVISRYKNNKCIQVWQIENEPLDPSGDKWWRISKQFLKEEVALARKLDPKRQILINLWGNELSKRKIYKKVLELADIVGFDLYLRHPIPFLKRFNRYIGPLDSTKKIKDISNDIKQAGKQFWITELQSEPWEPGEIITNRINPPSFLPKHLKQNYDYVKEFNPEAVLFWGFEWWYQKKIQGDTRYWKEAKKVLSSI